MHFSLFLFATTAILVVNGAPECPPSRSSIELALEEAHISGLVAIVVNSDSILYDQAFGYQSPTMTNPHLPMSFSNSMFAIASISKTLIAYAAMQLVESQQLDLDKDINMYLSPLPRIAHPVHPEVIITMRNVLSHMTSIGPNLDEELKEMYLPGDDFTRTNLSDVIYKFAGNASDWFYIPHFSLSNYPSGLLRMSGRTLAIFLQSFLKDGFPLLKQKSSMDEILHVYGRQSQPPEADAEYGLIWTWLQSGQRHLIGHRGSLPGFTNSMMANENRTIGVILLTNGDITRGDADAMRVYQASTSIMTQLFDCFDTNECGKIRSSLDVLLITFFLFLFHY
ncbi:unnamed protein product [Rotaria sp. Silwood2]|nr:unnamed protein product [Rotaria sp. Silwood2]